MERISYRWTDRAVVRLSESVRAAGVSRREELKRFGASKVAAQCDRLAERPHCAQIWALGGLVSVAFAAGKSNDWISNMVVTLCDARPELALHGRI